MIAINALANAAGMAVALLVQAGLAFGAYRLAGAEQYGLIGLYATLMVAAAVFDTGIGQAVTREVARRRHVPDGEASVLPTLLANFLLIYLALAAAIVIAALLGASAVATDWLRPQHIPTADVAHAIVLAAIAIAIQRVRGVFQATIDGLERQVVTNSLMASTNILRLALGLGSLVLFHPTAEVFFVSQIVASVIETGVFAATGWRVVAGTLAHVRFDPKLVVEAGRFAITNAAAAAVGTFLQIADSLIVSACVPLATFGNYSLISTLCVMMLRLATLVLAAAFPRLSALVHGGRSTEAVRLFFRTTEVTTIMIGTVAATLILFAQTILELMTGSAEVAHHFAPVLVLLAAAYTFSGLARGLHAVQLAEGRPGIALRISAGVGLFYLPVIWFLTPIYGVFVPALCLLAVNAATFALFVLTGFRHTLAGQSAAWLWKSVVRQIALIAVIQVLFALLPVGDALWHRLVLAALAAGTAFVVALLAGAQSRPMLFALIGRLAPR